MSERLLAIVGPTATGKTEVGILLAEMLEGEIISADSMQCYRGMDIGTAKPTPEQRSRVPHHLIDIVDPEEVFSVAEYRTQAGTALREVRGRGKQSILVGGSGLYVRAIVEGLGFPLAPPDQELRRRLMEEARELGRESIYQRLASVDPEAAAGIHPNNLKRVIRALEIHARTGRPASALWALDRSHPTRYNTMQFGLVLPRAELYRRIECRIDGMIAAGLVAEVRRLVDRGLTEDSTAMKGLGYAQLAPHVRGECTLEDAVGRLKRDTRRFAKRQLTWFRADPRIEWIEVMESSGPEGTAERIGRRWEETCSE
jgi:tRNA dimethylallyltransferase